MHIPAINSVNCTCGTKKGNNNNTSFGSVKIVGDAPVRLVRAIKSDYSIRELADIAEKRFKKDIVVDLHKQTRKVFGDMYKISLYVDNGAIGNMLNKMGLGKKIDVNHHNVVPIIENDCCFGLLYQKKWSPENVLGRLGLGK